MNHPSRAIGAVAALLFSATAAAQSVGDWTYQSQRSFYAATSNDSGNIFGQWCDQADRSCTYLMATTVRCTEGEEYVVLVNADSGASPATIVCRGPLEGRSNDGKSMHRYVFADFGTIDGIVKGASRRMAIAFPMHGDAFQVSRFSLAGAGSAISAMRGAAERSLPASGRSGTRDQRL